MIDGEMENHNGRLCSTIKLNLLTSQDISAGVARQAAASVPRNKRGAGGPQ
jgi:hypothetical protein